MKKVVLMLATVLAVGALASTASATGPILEDSGFACFVYDADGNLVVTTDSHFVWFASGKTYLRCEAQVVNDTGSRIEDSGFLCNVPISGLTTDTRSSIGRNGQSQLTCIGWADPALRVASAASSTAGVAG